MQHINNFIFNFLRLLQKLSSIIDSSILTYLFPHKLHSCPQIYHPSLIHPLFFTCFSPPQAPRPQLNRTLLSPQAFHPQLNHSIALKVSSNRELLIHICHHVSCFRDPTTTLAYLFNFTKTREQIHCIIELCHLKGCHTSNLMLVTNNASNKQVISILSSSGNPKYTYFTDKFWYSHPQS